MKKFDRPIYITRPILPPIDELKKKIIQIWDTASLTNEGMCHKELEKKITNLLKVPNISLFNNGTTALLVAIKALDLQGEVITTPFTFPATPHSLYWNGIKPVFCDIDDKTMNLNPDKIENLITSNTSAILGVHVFGTPCDVFRIDEIARKNNLKVIYDAAHAFQTEIEGIGIGNYGDISMFSFHATKLFHTAEGGALAYRDPSLKEKISCLRNFGIKNEEEVIVPGINGKMNELQACLGLTTIELLGEETDKRKKLLAIYKKRLCNVEGISLLAYQSNIKNSYQYFVIRINARKFGASRDETYNELKKYNIFSRKYFYPLCSDYQCYQNLPSSDPANLPVAKRVAEEVLALPFYGGLSEDDINMICDILLEIGKKA